MKNLQRPQPGRTKNLGLEGTLGGIRDFGHLVALLGAYFLPASSARPPSASGSNGNRTTVHTTQSAPSTTLPLIVAGGQSSLIWHFPVEFPVAPVVTFAPVGAPPSAGTTLYIVAGTPTKTSVQIQSTNNTDTRMVHLSASIPS